MISIISIERGNYNPSLELAFKIARHFDQNRGCFYLSMKQKDHA